MPHSLSNSRAIARLWLVVHALVNRWIFSRAVFNTQQTLSQSSTATPQRILIPMQFLLGDCILMLSLIQKVLEQHPRAELVVAAPAHAISIFKRMELPVNWVAWRERSLHDLKHIRQQGPFDIAYVPFEKWAPIWAHAFGAKRVTGFSFPSVWFHDYFLSNITKLPENTQQVSDWVMAMVSGEPAVYQPSRRLFSELAIAELTSAELATTDTFTASQKRTVILHIGARNENRRWLPQHWAALATTLRAQGFQVIWTYAANERQWSAQIAKSSEDVDTHGALSFDALMALIAKVDAVISPDTGVTHLCKLTGTPNVVIYGQGNPALHGNGHYWKLSPVYNVFTADVPCRSMQRIFGRTIDDLRRCDLGPQQCANPYCQNDIQPDRVYRALLALLEQAVPQISS